MKVLFVDDSKTMLKINVKNVKVVLGDEIEVLKANNGTEAIEAAKTGKPDLVLLDLVLPDMTGLDILAAINEMGLNATVGFISSMKTPENHEKAIQLGAKFFLDKPATPESIEKTLKEAGVI